jgi:hypothetical protein
LAIDAASTDPTLSDIRHVVILMQENRSFDHYFGTLSRVRGFSDPGIVHNVIDGAPRPVWEQFGYAPIVGRDPNGWLVPFHLQQRPPFDDGDTTNDIDHSWGTQHVSWNGGKMDAFVTAHLAADGVDNFAATMGYFQRSDLAFYTRWPTPSRSAMRTTARCSAPPTPTASWRSPAPSTPPAKPEGRCSSPRPTSGPSPTARSTGPPCPSSC